MCLLEYDFHPDALREEWEARQWYLSRNPEVAERFTQAVEQAIRFVCEHPESGTSGHSNTRQISVRKFPYFLIYRIREQRIEILAVAHTSRLPGFWKGRTEE